MTTIKNMAATKLTHSTHSFGSSREAHGTPPVNLGSSLIIFFETFSSDCDLRVIKTHFGIEFIDTLDNMIDDNTLETE